MKRGVPLDYVEAGLARCASPACPSRGRGRRALDKSLVALLALAGASPAFDTSSSINRWAAKPGSSNENTAKPIARNRLLRGALAAASLPGGRFLPIKGELGRRSAKKRGGASQE